MFIRKYWIPLSVFLVVIVGTGLYLLSIQSPKAPITIIKPVEVEKPTAEETPKVRDTTQDGHFHEDGTFHAQPHETHALPAETSLSDTQAVSEPSLVQIPDGITDPEVLVAWQRLDDIAKNPFQWGGRPSDRALELMDALTPMWVFDDPHDHGEELMMTLELLAAERDPRSAELLLTYQLDSGVSGRPIDEALVAMGPATVPALIARLNPEDTADVFFGPIIRDVVVPIVEQHRAELGGIVDYIIIPRLEAIAANIASRRARSNSPKARKALARLKK